MAWGSFFEGIGLNYYFSIEITCENMGEMVGMLGDSSGQQLPFNMYILCSNFSL